MKKKNKMYVVIVFSLAITLVTVLLIINIVGLYKNNNSIKVTTKEYTTVKITTTSEVSDFSTNNKVIKVMIGTEEEKINFKTYVSYVGFQIDYMSDYFTPSTTSNKVVLITSNQDNKSYIKIETLDEDIYYKEYKETKNEEKDGYLYSYEFLRGNNIFVKVTKSIDKRNNIFLSERMDYMLNTFYFN